MARTVLVLPGVTYGPHVPQLFLPAFAATRRGAELRTLEWAPQPFGDPPPDAVRTRWVETQVEPLLDGLEAASAVVVGKSLGTRAARVVADRGLPAVWVTPLLTEPSVLDGLADAAAPLLLVGGTADPFWDGTAARSLTPHVLELEHADHGLFMAGPLAASVRNLGRLATATEDFLDRVVWPLD